MNRYSMHGEYLFIAVFIIVLFGIGAVSSTRVPDYISSSDGSIIKGEAAANFETLYDEDLAIRTLGMSTWAALRFQLFGEAKSGVHIGDNGWLFSKEELYAPENHQDNLLQNLETIRAVSEYLQKKGIALILIHVPAKADIYREYTGSTSPSPFMTDLYDTGIEQLRTVTPYVVDITNALKALGEGNDSFFRTDTHWTPIGASAASHQVADFINQLDVSLSPKTFKTIIKEHNYFHGDLTKFLPLDPWFKSLMPLPDELELRETVLIDEQASGESDDLFGDEQVDVVLIGTSYSANPDWNFAGSLRTALSSDLVNLAKEGKGPIEPMLQYIQSDDFASLPPQLILWEFPIRYLPMQSTAATMAEGTLKITEKG